MPGARLVPVKSQVRVCPLTWVAAPAGMDSKETKVMVDGSLSTTFTLLALLPPTTFKVMV